MNKYQKYVNAAFLAASAIVWFLAQHYVGVALGYFQLGRKIGVGADVIQHVLPLVLGIGTFLALRANSQTLHFTTDAIAELTRVSWPNQREVRIGTIVVIVTVVLAGIALGVLDLGYTRLIATLLGA